MEFDYQWKNLQDPNLAYNKNKIVELLGYTGLNSEYLKGKHCLDAGCGTGRWTWAMMQMGSLVDSFDISAEAIKQCKKINPKAYVFDLLNLEPSEKYDFVLCWGVLHHLKNPLEGFLKVASTVRLGGILHIMVYHKDTQRQYEPMREAWKKMNEKQRIAYCKKCVAEKGGTIHGWWDALNPEYNWGFHPNEVKSWFQKSRFKKIKLVRLYNINMRGQKKEGFESNHSLLQKLQNIFR
jgi:2-polyprenyl-3-methyl-5-hydroxy-6-metoxy-1,4-benzoquinol methylase